MTTIKELYEIICSETLGNNFDSVQRRVNIVQLLEKTTNNNFKNTADFHEKMRKYLLKQELARDMGAEHGKTRLESLSVRRKGKIRKEIVRLKPIRKR